MAFSLGQGMRQEGFREFYDTVKKLGGDAGDFGVEYELKRKLRAIGEGVAKTAPSFVTHRYKDSGALEGSVKVSSGRAGVSVYSTSVYGGVQNVGGWSKGRGPHVSRGNASRWMLRAVESSEPVIEKELTELVHWVTREIELG